MALDLFATASELSDCVCAALKAQEHPDPGTVWDGNCCVWPGGEVVFDSCCEGQGQAWVVVTDGGPTRSFPAITQEAANCKAGTTLAVTFQVGVIRGVCNAECGCDRKERDAQDVLLDLQAMIRGVACCLAARDLCEEWVMGGFQMIGPDGCCAGSQLTVTLNLPMPCCPSESP